MSDETSDVAASAAMYPTIGKPLRPKRETTWIRATLTPQARCDGLMIGDVAVADPCGWRAGHRYAMAGAEVKREATAHTRETGHVVVIEQINRTVVSPDDERDLTPVTSQTGAAR